MTKGGRYGEHQAVSRQSLETIWRLETDDATQAHVLVVTQD